MLTRKIIDIRLEEEKFYFPGETIKGFVIVHPKSAIKVNSVQLKFYGEVFINLKEKEYNTLFEKTLALSVYPNSTVPRQTTLDASEHSFSFEFIVPKNSDLPSSMEFGKKGHVRYTINAILDRPLIPESLCPKADYTVSLLEYIDIEQPQFRMPQEKSQDIMLSKAKYNQKCMLRASMPRLGFTRGDIVPLKVIIDHFTSFERKNGVTVDLIRTVEIRTTRHTVFKETTLKSTPHDIDTSQHQQQMISCQILIPTSTPPSIRYKDKVLRFHYKVRISAYFGKKESCTLDLPIVIGTWPRAAVPIDDDDDEQYKEDDLGLQLDSSIMTDEDEHILDDDDSVRTSSVDDPSSVRNSSNMSYKPANTREEAFVARSDSVTSRASNHSTSSHHSTRSWEHHYYYHHHQPPPSQPPQLNNSYGLSRNTSQCTTVSSPDRLPSYYNNNFHGNGHHRSSSIYSNEYPASQRNSLGYNQRLSMASLPPIVTQPPPPQSPQYRYPPISRYGTRLEDEAPSIILEHDVPTHILEPISFSTPTPTPTPSIPPPSTDIETAMDELSVNDSSSSLEDSDDEDDLLAIIERKKKREQKASKRKVAS
ncbi:hypothetical protein BD560DRAFT_494119 [Blakeslea trispora]|nr:hypothetical protein BD560DRAFT_494119 [Blakeslea trispora]